MTTYKSYVYDGSNWKQMGYELQNEATVVYQATEPISPVVGTIWIDTSQEAATYDTTVPTGFRNFIINGRMDISQRGDVTVSGTPNANTYGGPDRWWGQTNGVSNQSVAMSSVAFTVGQTEVPGEPVKHLRAIFTVAGSPDSSSTMRILQMVEDVRTLAGQQATFSYWAKAESARTGWVGIDQNFGSGGSTRVPVLIESINLTTSWQKFTHTITIPSISGKTVGASSNLRVTIGLYKPSAFYGESNGIIGSWSTGTLDVANVQLERGANATPFEQRPYSTELALCQRYFQRWANPPLRGVCNSAGIPTRIGMPLPVPMRVAPSGTAGAGTSTFSGTNSIWDGAGIVTVASISGNMSTTATVEYDVNLVSGSLTAYRPAIMYQGTAGYLDLNAEF